VVPLARPSVNDNNVIFRAIERLVGAGDGRIVPPLSENAGPMKIRMTVLSGVKRSAPLTPWNIICVNNRAQTVGNCSEPAPFFVR